MTTHRELIIKNRNEYGVTPEMAERIDRDTGGWEDYTGWLESELAFRDLALEAASAAQPAPASPLVTIGGVSFVLIDGAFINIALIEQVEIDNKAFYACTHDSRYHISKDNSQYPALCALFGFTPKDDE